MKCIGLDCEYCSKTYTDSHKETMKCELFDRFLYVDTGIYRDKNKITMKTNCFVDEAIEKAEKRLQNYKELKDVLFSK